MLCIALYWTILNFNPEGTAIYKTCSENTLHKKSLSRILFNFLSYVFQGLFRCEFFLLNTNVKKKASEKKFIFFKTMFNVNLCQGYLIFFPFFFIYLLKKNYFGDILLERNQKSLEFESKVWEPFGSNHNITKYLCSLPLAPLVDSRTLRTCDDETVFAWVSWSSAHEHISSRCLWWRRVHRRHGLNNQVSPPRPTGWYKPVKTHFCSFGVK